MVQCSAFGLGPNFRISYATLKISKPAAVSALCAPQCQKRIAMIKAAAVHSGALFAYYVAHAVAALFGPVTLDKKRGHGKNRPFKWR